MVDNDTERAFYYYVFASQNPEFVVFARMQPLTPYLLDMQGRSLQDVFVLQSLFTKYKFRLEANPFVLDRDIPFPPGAKAKVLPFLFWLRQGCLGSDADIVPVKDMAQGVAERVPSTKARSAKAPAIDPALLAEHPWLQAHLQGRRAEAAPPRASSSVSAPAQPSDPEATPALDDEAVEAAFISLEKKRAEWEAGLSVSQPDFVDKIRGGAWTKANKGRDADCVEGQAKGQRAKAWCAREGLTKSASFAFRLYSEKTAGILVREWCRRMQFWYDLSKLADGSVAGQEGIRREPPPEPEEFAELMAASNGSGPAHARGLELRRLRPASA